MGKQTKKSTSSRGWSDRQWSQDHGAYYQVKENHGEVEYRWLPPDPTEPRHGGEDITHRIGQMSLSETGGSYQDTSAATELSHDASSPSQYYTHQYQGTNVANPAPGHTGYAQDHDYSQASAYGQNDPYSTDPTYGQNPGLVQQPAVHSSSRGGNLAHSGQHYAEEYSENSRGKGKAPATDHYSGLESTDAYEEDEDEDEVERALRQSRADTYGRNTDGEASSSAYADPNIYDPNIAATYGDPNLYGDREHALNEYDDEAQYGTGHAALLSDAPVDPAILSGTGENHVMGEDYKVEHSNRFQPGEVFKILWSEPRGAQSQPNTEMHNVPMTDIHKTEGFYVGIRRFIVIASDQGHSTCVPILTYEKKGCNKKGVHASKHGVIYEKKHKPRLLNGEGPMGYKAVAVELYADGEKLARESRVNYSKLVTIEHNTNVFFIGKISDRDFHIVSNAVDDCWQNKRTQRSSKKHGSRK